MSIAWTRSSPPHAMYASPLDLYSRVESADRDEFGDHVVLDTVLGPLLAPAPASQQLSTPRQIAPTTP